jgi:hypothetical protein
MPLHQEPAIGNVVLSALKSLTMFAVGLPGGRFGGLVIAAFRDAGAVSRSTAQRYRPATDSEEAAFRGLLATGIIRQPEPGRFYLDEDSLDSWYGWRQA